MTAAGDRNRVVDEVVQQQLAALSVDNGLNRRNFVALPYPVACEIMAAWLRAFGVKEIDRKLIDLVVVSVKTLPPGKKISLGRKTFLSIGQDDLRLG